MPDKNYCAIGQLYAERVIAGDIPACELVKLACQRQINDLQRLDWDFTFDEDRANHVCWFIENLPHIEGTWKSRNIELEPWQCFFLTTIFGWVDENGYRRYRKVYIECPRKNAKTTIAAAVALYMLCADGENGAKVYSAAVTREQASISWNAAWNMVKREKEMQEYYGIQPLAHSIVAEAKAGSFKALSRDSNSLEGLNPHCSVIDELHAHKTREIFDVLNLAKGSRKQPLLFIITTAGDNRVGVCYEQHDYITQILNERHVDDRYFGIIYTIDTTDDWTTELSARKANPNYGISVGVEDFDSDSKQAQRSAQSQNSFLTKRLNIWVSTGTAYFNMLSWHNLCRQNEFTLEDFYEEPCYVALDLASKVDIAAKVFLFRRGKYRYVFAKYYLPEQAVERGNPNYDLYAGWAREGRLTLTPGYGEIDFDYIATDLLEDRAKFQVLEVPYDPFQATQLATQMRKEGLIMNQVDATVRNYSEPMKALEAMVLNGTIKHDGDPILGWMMGNVYGQVDRKDNVYPRKVRNENKIDGAVALIIALNRALLDEGGSVYDTRGIITL